MFWKKWGISFVDMFDEMNTIKIWKHLTHVILLTPLFLREKLHISKINTNSQRAKKICSPASNETGPSVKVACFLALAVCWDLTSTGDTGGDGERYAENRCGYSRKQEAPIQSDLIEFDCLPTAGEIVRLIEALEIQKVENNENNFVVDKTKRLM